MWSIDVASAREQLHISQQQYNTAQLHAQQASNFVCVMLRAGSYGFMFNVLQRARRERSAGSARAGRESYQNVGRACGVRNALAIYLCYNICYYMNMRFYGAFQ